MYLIDWNVSCFKYKVLKYSWLRFFMILIDENIFLDVVSDGELFVAKNSGFNMENKKFID